MKIRNLDTFFWIAKLGSFRAASEQLHLTQPAISARIQVLEQDLGAEVFVRDTKSAELTLQGRKLLPFAESLMKLDQSIVEAFSDTTTVQQVIRLGSSETIVGTWLPEFLAQFSQSQPNWRFELTVDTTNNLRNALVAREIDLGFLMGPLAEASIHNTDLCTYDLAFWAIPELANKHKKWMAADLAQQSMITYQATTRPHMQLKEMLQPHVDNDLKITGSASVGAILRLALSGFGICFLPQQVLKNHIQTGELCALNTDIELPEISFTSSYVLGSHMSPLVGEISNLAANFPKSTS